ncbi:MAG: hypothetical protein ACXW18_08180, partial [Pyrinomonadaceae bacterium]
MPKTIIQTVLERQQELLNDPVLATQNMALAMAAMRDGIKSEAWQQYMSQFVEQSPPGKPVDPDQLARLTAKDGTLGDQVLDRQRAYLVANAICGPSTVTTIDFGVDTIDYTMANVGHIERPEFDCPTTTITDTGVAGAKPSKRRSSKKKAA